MYTAIEDVAAILQERREDANLMRRIEEYLGGPPPASLTDDDPKLMLCRHVATCTGEDEAFRQLATEAGLTPHWGTYEADAFNAENPSKLGLVKLPVLTDPGRLDRFRHWKLFVCEPSQYEQAKMTLGQVRTRVHGLTVPQLHHQLREAVWGEFGQNHHSDWSDWLHEQATRRGCPDDRRSMARYYYAPYLAQFVAHAALVEDFHSGPNADSGKLDGFMIQVVEPALREIEEQIGLPPVIVRLPWQPEYRLYPPVVHNWLMQRLRS